MGNMAQCQSSLCVKKDLGKSCPAAHQSHCRTGKHRRKHKCRRMEERSRFFQEVRQEKQLIVRHVKAHVAGESRKQMKDNILFNTEGNDGADQ